MRFPITKKEDVELRDVMETYPSSSGDDCFKRNEEMRFEAPAFFEHGYCDDVKRNYAFKGDVSTFVQPGSFSWSEC